VKYVLDILSSKLDFTVTCPECGKEVSGASIMAFNESGDGGIHISAKDWSCEECYYAKCCGYCDEFQGNDEMVEIDNECYKGMVCEYCHEKLLKANEELLANRKLQEWNDAMRKTNEELSSRKPTLKFEIESGTAYSQQLKRLKKDYCYSTLEAVEVAARIRFSESISQEKVRVGSGGSHVWISYFSHILETWQRIAIITPIMEDK
jgi:hypothetical protein